MVSGLIVQTPKPDFPTGKLKDSVGGFNDLAPDADGDCILDPVMIKSRPSLKIAR